MLRGRLRGLAAKQQKKCSDPAAKQVLAKKQVTALLGKKIDVLQEELKTEILKNQNRTEILNHNNITGVTNDYIYTESHWIVIKDDDNYYYFRNKYDKCLILTEGVFSMDGDISPQDDISALKKKY